MTDKDNEHKINLNLTRGSATYSDVANLVKIYQKKHENAPDDQSKFTELIAYKELLWRLQTSVFSEKGKFYPVGFRRYCIVGEYHNTKLFIKLIGEILKIGQTIGDITKPSFCGQPDPGYSVSLEVLIHILLRHNETINSFLNPDSKGHKRSPSSFESGSIGPIMLRLFMALNALRDDDWKKAEKGKDKYICHFNVGNRNYTIVANGAKEIISFYPRTDDLDSTFIKLVSENSARK